MFTTTKYIRREFAIICLLILNIMLVIICFQLNKKANAAAAYVNELETIVEYNVGNVADVAGGDGYVEFYEL